jgi:hypothetical protein
MSAVLVFDNQPLRGVGSAGAFARSARTHTPFAVTEETVSSNNEVNNGDT